MKRLSIPILISGAVIGAAGASTTMCVRTGTYIVSLIPTRDGISQSVDSDNVWWVGFDYYTNYITTTATKTKNVTGIASCNDNAGTAGVADKDLVATAVDTGVHCWCAMETPLVSDWVYLQVFSDEATCAANCSTNCATTVKTDDTFRSTVYQSIW